MLCFYIRDYLSPLATDVGLVNFCNLLAYSDSVFSFSWKYIVSGDIVDIFSSSTDRNYEHPR